MQHNPDKLKNDGIPPNPTPAQLAKMRTIVQAYDANHPNARLAIGTGIPHGCKVMIANARRATVIILCVIGLCAIVTVCTLTLAPAASEPTATPATRFITVTPPR